MDPIKDIQQAVSKLSGKDLSSFRKWFEEFDAEIWDQQLEEDVRKGRLDPLAEHAIAQFRAGKCKPL